MRLSTLPNQAPSTASSCTAERPWLSILIPVYNVEPYLLECLNSVANQALDGVEIVVIDDASTDASSDLLTQWNQAHEGRLRVLTHPQNSGIGAARNSLIQSARGEYIWFLDSDDIMLPGAVTRLREILDQRAVDMVLCDFKIVRPVMKLKHRLRGELHVKSFALKKGSVGEVQIQLTRGVFASGQVHLWTKIFRRQLIAEGFQFPVGRCFEDVAMMPELLSRARSYFYAPEVWIGYRKRPGSILAGSGLAKNDDMMQSLLGLPRRLPSDLDTETAFACAFFSAGFFLSACRQAGKLGAHERLPLYLAQFAQSIPLPIPSLLKAYRGRGWWWRAAKLQHWVKRCTAGSDQKQEDALFAIQGKD